MIRPLLVVTDGYLDSKGTSPLAVGTNGYLGIEVEITGTGEKFFVGGGGKMINNNIFEGEEEVLELIHIINAFLICH